MEHDRARWRPYVCGFQLRFTLDKRNLQLLVRCPNQKLGSDVDDTMSAHRYYEGPGSVMRNPEEYLTMQDVYDSTIGAEISSDFGLRSQVEFGAIGKPDRRPATNAGRVARPIRYIPKTRTRSQSSDNGSCGDTFHPSGR